MVMNAWLRQGLGET